jgi:hypothetical protein
MVILAVESKVFSRIQMVYRDLPKRQQPCKQRALNDRQPERRALSHKEGVLRDRQSKTSGKPTALQ